MLCAAPLSGAHLEVQQTAGVGAPGIEVKSLVADGASAADVGLQRTGPPFCVGRALLPRLRHGALRRSLGSLLLWQ